MTGQTTWEWNVSFYPARGGREFMYHKGNAMSPWKEALQVTKMCASKLLLERCSCSGSGSAYRLFICYSAESTLCCSWSLLYEDVKTFNFTLCYWSKSTGNIQAATDKMKVRIKFGIRTSTDVLLVALPFLKGGFGCKQGNKKKRATL